jgi:hypothetical protein
LTSTPTINDFHWNSVLKSVVLQPSFNPQISLINTASNEKGFLFTAAQKSNVLPSLIQISSGDQRKEIDFNMVESSGEIYSIGKPFALYSLKFWFFNTFLEKAPIASIVPSLVKVGELITYDINFNDQNTTIPLSADVQVTLNGVVLPGKVISGTVVRFQQTLTDADQIYSFSVSFDKVQSILSGNVKIYTFGLK